MSISSKNKGPISQFMEKHYLHFNAAATVDAAKGYETHLTEGGKMLVSLAGAMSTAELGKSLAEMIRQGKVDIISCTGANLEEDIMNCSQRSVEWSVFSTRCRYVIPVIGPFFLSVLPLR